MPLTFISEVLDDIKKAETEEKKISLLHQHQNVPLKKILYAALVSKVKFLIEGKVKYTPLDIPAGLADTSLFQEVKKLYLFVEGGAKLTDQKRLDIYTVILESLQKDEAEVLESVRTKTLSEKYNLPRSVVEKAFPNFLPVEVAPESITPIGRPKGAPNTQESKAKRKQRKLDKQAKKEQEQQEAVQGVEPAVK
jgi:hypothetical protein